MRGLTAIGVTRLAVDSASILGPLGSLPDGEITEGLELLAEDALTSLGTSVVTRGGAPGQLAMRVTVSRAGWLTSQSVSEPVGRGCHGTPTARKSSRASGLPAKMSRESAMR